MASTKDIAASLALELELDLGKSKEPVKGLWFNRRALSTIALFAEHRTQLLSGGWESTVTKKGDVHVRYLDGRYLRLELVAGDRVRSLGEDIFVLYAAFQPPTNIAKTHM